MSAFRVFGVSLTAIETGIRKAFPSKGLSMDEWQAETATLALDKFNGKNRLSPVSYKFDTPHFCQDFIDLCSSEKFKGLEIRCLKKTGKTVDKGKRKGLPEYKWERYSQQ